KEKQILCRVSSLNALFVVFVTSISDGPFFLTTAFVSVISTVILRHLYRNSTLSPASSTIIHLRLFPTRQTRNRFHHSHIRLQLQVTLICESLIYAIGVVIIID
ncbi:unnamed protein product, partial [Brassica oleracea var. botrytis]